MKLTGRQREFLGSFLDIYHQAEEPLHYAHVAERLGVSKITAYDMLRVLEKRGLVRSKYVIPPEGRGVGRSTIVFSPTEAAEQLFSSLTAEAQDIADWEKLKAYILERLQSRQIDEYKELLEELLARLPDRQSPLLFVTEMITAVLLSLQLARKGLAEQLRLAGFPAELGLGALSGIAVGLTFMENVNRRVTTLLLKQSRRYMEMLKRVSPEGQERLQEFVREMLGVFR